MEIKHFISHRGNLQGPNLEEENRVKYINNALSKGFECEIDVWYLKNQFFLGHDKPEEVVSLDFIIENESMLWIHCKNLESIQKFTEIKTPNFFWHEKDKYTLTSKNYIWTYPNQITDKRCIIVNLESRIPNGEYMGICSDYISKIKENIK
jgi:hypothetical protein